MSISFRVSILTILVASSVLSCKEPLPPYNDPRNVFSASLVGLYNVSSIENSVKAYLTVVNTFDETFDGEALANGTLVITWERDRLFKKTVQLNSGSILFARRYEPSTGILRIDPGDSVRFGFSWDMISDDGRSLFDLVQFIPDPTCPVRRISSEPLMMSLEGRVTIYNRTGTAVAPSIRFSFVLHREYVPSRLCG